jgi:hypothetical protein
LGNYVLEKLGELAHACIAHEHVEPAEFLDRFGDEVPAGLGLGNVACDGEEARLVCAGFDLVHVLV